MTHVLFIADQFSDSPRTQGESHPGGAELTDEAAIAACPWSITCQTFDELQLSFSNYDIIVIGNSATATPEQLDAIASTRRHILFEHDVRICKWRGNFPRALEPLHRFQQKCVCPHRSHRALYDQCLGAIFLTHRQLATFAKNPFYRCEHEIVLGSSLFRESFFERMDGEDLDRNGDVVFGSRNPIKGFKQSLQFCRDQGKEPFIIRGMTPQEVLETFRRSARFVYLPIGLEPAGRMPVEARFFGCEVVANAHVGVAGEAWWRLPQEAALGFLLDGPDRFWRIVEALVSRTFHVSDMVGVESFAPALP